MPPAASPAIADDVSWSLDVETLLERLRPAYEDFYTRSGEEVYGFRAGLKETLDLEAILRDYPLLSSRETLSRIRSLEEGRPASKPAGPGDPLRLFERICLDRRLEEESAAEIVRLEEAQAKEAETVDGQRQSFFAATLVAAVTGEREKRNRLALAHGAMCRRLLSQLVAKWEAQDGAARATGFRGYVEASARIRQVDLPATVERLRAALDPRSEKFVSDIREWLDRTGMRAEDGRIEVHDLWHLWQADLGGDAFTGDRLVPALRGTLEGLGLDVLANERVVVDLEPRDTKNPRPFCVPVRIPARVYLVMQPVGGSRDFSQLFHETGHALHFSSISAELPMEWKDGTGYALTESYAFLFEHLIHDPLWLEELGGSLDREAFDRLARLRIEYLVRRLTSEMTGQLASDGAAATRPEAVATAFREIVGLPVDPSAAAFYVDDGLYAAEYARGFAFSALLRERLRSRYGRRWWRSRAAGDFLRELWSTGNRWNTEAMAEQLFGQELSFEVLVQELER